MSEQPTPPDAPVDDPGDGQTTPADAQAEAAPPGSEVGQSFTGTPAYGVDDPEEVAGEAQAGG